MPTAQPMLAHQALMTELHAVVDRFALNGMPAVERIAILAQLIGQEAVHIDHKTIDQSQLLYAVARNIANGNQQASGGFLTSAPAILGVGGSS